MHQRPVPATDGPSPNASLLATRSGSQGGFLTLIPALTIACLLPSCLLFSDLSVEGVQTDSGDTATVDITDDSEADDTTELRDLGAEDAPDTGDASDSFDASEDTSRPTFNLCGGETPLLYSGAPEEPGAACGDFDDGVLVCNGRDALECILASVANECGGPGALPAPLGEPCGCGGITVCAADGGVECADAVQRNACGGCEPLEGRPGFYCESETVVGRYVCRSLDELICVPGGGNACGGEETLQVGGSAQAGVFPGDSCESGACGAGTYVCEGDNGLRCVPNRPCNACGGVQSLAGVPESACGVCGTGRWECNGADAVQCVGSSAPNVCGGCEALSDGPGAACEVEGVGVEADLPGVVVCRAGATVCSPLGRAPGADAGGGAVALNACGGTRALTIPAGLPQAGQPATVGATCGTCGRGVWLCDGADGVRCSVPEAQQQNVCGGCTPITARPNTPCGTCGTGRLTCDGTDRLSCQGDLGETAGRNTCGGCGTLPGLAGNVCGSCLRWECSGTRLECAPTTVGAGCDGLTRCADLDCEDANRACAETDGVVNAVCGGCRSGFVEAGDGSGTCRPVLTCEGLACAGEGRLCTAATTTTDAVCGACASGFVAGGPACRPLIQCDDLTCADDNRDCVDATTTTDARCDACIEGWLDDGGSCRPVVTCVGLGCAGQFRTCTDATATTDAVCGACVPGYQDRAGVCTDVITCADLNCAAEARACTEAAGLSDAECGACLPSFVSDGVGGCRAVVACSTLNTTCAGQGRVCTEATDTADAVCGACESTLVSDAGSCRAPRTCEDLGCAALERTCTPSAPGLDARCEGCREGWVDLGDRCSPVNCGTLASPANGSVDVPDSVFGSTATYSCASGYELVGDSQRQCQASGLWNGSPPACAPKDCGPTPSVHNATVSAPITTTGATATWLCASRYVVREGTSTAQTCDGFGWVWGGTPLRCDAANPPWINEVLASQFGDAEGVEIAGPAGASIAGVRLVYYSSAGNPGSSTILPPGSSLPAGYGVTAHFVALPSLGNLGGQIALVAAAPDNTVLDHVSWGTLSGNPTTGLAAGSIATPTGVLSNISTTTFGRVGTGCSAASFGTWVTLTPPSPGAMNADQTSGSCSLFLGDECRADSECPAHAWCSTVPGYTVCAPRLFSGQPYQMDFALVPAGTFEQGTPGATNEERPYTATITRNYFVSRTEITQGQWKAATAGVNPSCFQSTSGTSCTTTNANDNGPVERIDWYSAVAYANWLSSAQGLEPCYTLTPSTCADTVSDWAGGDTVCTAASFTGLTCTGYRLLTESEWERAARAGTTSTYYWGEATDTATVGLYAWFSGNSGSRTAAVAQKLPNAYGLYDMSGNVWEWIWDRYTSGYPAGSSTDYIGPASGSGRGIRGGFWDGGASGLRSADRRGNGPSDRYGSLGLRLARTAN